MRKATFYRVICGILADKDHVLQCTVYQDVPWQDVGRCFVQAGCWRLAVFSWRIERSVVCFSLNSVQCQ